MTRIHQPHGRSTRGERLHLVKILFDSDVIVSRRFKLGSRTAAREAAVQVGLNFILNCRPTAR